MRNDDSISADYLHVDVRASQLRLNVKISVREMYFLLGRIINFYRQRKRAQRMKRIMPYVKLSEDSYYDPSFNVDIRFPKRGHIYLETGSHCVLSGSYVFEKNILGNSYVLEGGHIKIGDRCHIGMSRLIASNEIIIDDDVTIAWGCLIYDHNSHSVNWSERMHDTEQEYSDICSGLNPIHNKDWSVVKSAPIHICSKAWIGVDCKILKGVTIGEGAIVGAGSVVTKDVEAWTVVGGNPARVLKRLQ